MKWFFVIGIVMSLVVVYRWHLPPTENPFYRTPFDRVQGDRAGGMNKTDKTNRTDRTDRTDRTNKMRRLIIPVPFQPQAPFADWNEPWNEACEEAALVLANRFARNLTTLTPEEMRDEILQLVKYQNEHYGDYEDSDAGRTAEIGRAVYGINAEAEKVKNVEEIKTLLRDGNIVIAPMAGRLLNNPYFRQPGPLYHMVVVRGFDDEQQEFVTNDVGTRRGEGYRYPYATLWNALHDFPGEKERILRGDKRIMVIKSQPW
ncbi:MAG: C39 family peptidase [Patescibacteria group bacterium]